MSLDPVLMKVLDIERGELDAGITQTPLGSNNVKYNLDYYFPKKTRDLWCVVFQWWCFKQAGIPNSIFPRTAGVLAVQSFFEDRQRFHSSPEVGDLVILIYTKNGKVTGHHIGLIESIDGSTFKTIEGNYNDRVARVTHKTSESAIAGYCRPAYEDVAAPERSPGGVTEAILQSLPRLVKGDSGIDVRRLHGLIRAAGQPLPGLQNSDGTFKSEFTDVTAHALRALTGRTTVTGAQWKFLLGV